MQREQKGKEEEKIVDVSVGGAVVTGEAAAAAGAGAVVLAAIERNI